MNGIRIYVEGGGDGKNSKAIFRRGMQSFLEEICDLAQSKRLKWDVIACGSRNDAFRNFQNALRSHPESFNILLVDSEAPVTKTTRTEHLQVRDGWDIENVNERQCHLMVQVMENWLLTDPDALEKFYGQNFNRSAIPGNRNVEEIDKRTVEQALKAATRRTQKGEYHKIRHGPELLKHINIAQVCDGARHCRIFITTLTDFIEDC